MSRIYKTKNAKSQVTYVAALLRRFKRFDFIDAENYDIANISAVICKVRERFPKWKIRTHKNQIVEQRPSLTGWLLRGERRTVRTGVVYELTEY